MSRVSDYLSKTAMRPPLVFSALPNQTTVKNKTVVITGASSGIGAAAAKRFAELGAKVILVARRETELAGLATEIVSAGGVAEYLTCDLTDFDQVDELAAKLVARGDVDILVNNAGHSIRRSVAKSRMHDYERLMTLNYLSPVRLTLGLLPALVARGGGQIINVATWAVLMPGTPLFGGYIASKAALAAFGDTVRAEYERKGVLVSTLYYPLVKTPMIAPTEAFTDQPALSAEEGAEWMIQAVQKQLTEVAPRIGGVVRAISGVLPGATRRAVTKSILG